MYNNKTSIFVLCFIIIFGFVLTSYQFNSTQSIPHFIMPIVKCDLPYINFGEPQPKQDESVLNYLQCCVRIRNGDLCGSGTICYFDYDNNECYIISCGHLFQGSKAIDSVVKEVVDVNIFYKNDKKLKAPQVFKGEVLCYSETYDVSLIKFNPDWKIDKTFHIAPVSYPLYKGQSLESTGCDYGNDPASYTIEVYDGIKTGQNLITRRNSPRLGRSGGGVFTADGHFIIGIVRATSNEDGSGYGVSVSIRTIHEYLSKSKKTSWLLKQYNEVDFIPMIDKDRTLMVPPGYIPIPK